MPRFHRAVRYTSVWHGLLILAIPPPKVGQGPKISGLSHSYLWKKTAKDTFIEEIVSQKFAVLLGRPPLVLFV